VIREDFVIGQTLAEVQAKAAANVDRFVPPTVSISKPSNGTTVHDAKLAVSGVATDNVGVASLTVNGAGAAVGAGGAFSTTVALNVGANTITAVARDAAGATGQAQVAVTYPKPKLKLEAPETTLEKLLRTGRLKVKVHANDASTATLSATVAKGKKKSKPAFKKAKVRFSKPGTKTAKLKLTKAGHKALKGKRKATIKVTAKAKDTVGNKAHNKKLKLKLKR
jgi:hypothetical protein